MTTNLMAGDVLDFDGFCQVSILSHSKDIPPQPSRFGRAVAWRSQESQRLQVKDVKAGDW